MQQVVHLQGLMEKFGDRGFRVVAVSSEPTASIRKKVIEDRKGGYLLGSDPGRETVNHYTQPGRRGIPHSYIIDAFGMVVGEGMPTEDQIEELLKDTFDPAIGRDLHRSLKSARKEYEKGHPGKAWDKASRLLTKDDEAVVEDAKFLTQKVEDFAAFRKKFIEKCIAAKNYPLAMGELEAFTRDFAKLDSADWAEETLKGLESDDSVKLELKAWDAFLKVRVLEEKAGSHKRKIAPVKAAYGRIATKYPGTRAAKAAEEAVARLP